MQNHHSADPGLTLVLQQRVRLYSCLSAKHQCQMPVRLETPLQQAGFALLPVAELQGRGMAASAVGAGSLSVSGTEAAMGMQAVLGTVTGVSLGVAQKTDTAVTCWKQTFGMTGQLADCSQHNLHKHIHIAISAHSCNKLQSCCREFRCHQGWHDSSAIRVADALLMAVHRISNNMHAVLQRNVETELSYAYVAY